MRPCSACLVPAIMVVLGVAGCSDRARYPGPALDIPEADAAAAQACAAKLPPVADIIYKDAEPDVHASTNMESLLREKVLMLIIRDEVKRSDARPAAERAAECLEMLQK